MIFIKIKDQDPKYNQDLSSKPLTNYMVNLVKVYRAFGCDKKLYIYNLKKTLFQSSFLYNFKSNSAHKIIFGGHNY